MEVVTASLMAWSKPPPRLMFATAGAPAAWSPVTQSMPRDDAGVGAGAGAVEHLDRDQGDALGHAVGGAADGAGDVGAVAVAVGVVAIAGGVGAPRSRGHRSRCA